MSVQATARWLREHEDVVQTVTVGAAGWVEPLIPWSSAPATNQFQLRGAVVSVDAAAGVGAGDAEFRLRDGATWAGAEITIVCATGSAEDLDIVALPSTVLATLAAGDRAVVRNTSTGWQLVSAIIA